MAIINLALFQVLTIISLCLSIVSHNLHGAYGAVELRHCGIDGIYIFGSSMFDTGNAIIEIPWAKHGQWPYGKTINKTTGRQSDGLLIIDYIAKSIGLPLVAPFLDRNATHTSGVNFAVCGATTLPTEVLEEKNVKKFLVNSSVNVQLGWLDNYLKGHCKSTKACHEKLKSSLFSINFGGNDYGYAFSEKQTIEEVKQKNFTSDVVKAIEKAIEKLIHLGARRLIVWGLYPYGCSPAYLTRQIENKTATYDSFNCLKDYNDFFIYHNDQVNKSLMHLRIKYPHVHVVYGDLFKAMYWIFDNNQRLGFKSLTKACCGPQNKYNYIDGDFNKRCGTPGIPDCSRPEEYFFWDEVHFTQQAYKIIARKFLGDVFSKYLCNRA